MISIVTAYYNRKALFERTLQSIDRQIKEFGLSVEVIAVDDGSKEEERLEDLVGKYPFLKIIYLDPKNKWYKNSCIPFNIGFREAKGDKIIIQNPECYHLGNVLEYTEKNLKDNLYLSFGCYSLNKKITENIDSYLLDDNIYDCIEKNSYVVSNDGDLGWYNHSKYRPEAFHFCAAISKKDLKELGGFDEFFSFGIGYDDNEIISRIRKKGMEIIFLDNEVVLHQNHYVYKKLSEIDSQNINFLKEKNKNIFKVYTQNKERYSVNLISKHFNLKIKKKILPFLINFNLLFKNYQLIFQRKLNYYHFKLSLLNNSLIRRQVKNPKTIPIIIINFNQLFYLIKQVDFFLKRGFENIVIVDNKSSYSPLLEYYNELKSNSNVTIELMTNNYGHMVFFDNEILQKKYGKGFYFLTDADIVPNANLPLDFFEEMLEIMKKHFLNVTKIGFALDINNLPKTYLKKENVIDWEKDFWKNNTLEKIESYYAPIDTTFALYKPSYPSKYKKDASFFEAIRLAGDYTALHGGWYVDYENLTEEQEFYFSSVNSSSSWKVNSDGTFNEVFNSKY